MGGSSGGSQTVTNRTEIDPVTQQWRSAILGAGTGLYNQGTLPFYPGSTVVPFSDQTQSGLNYLENYAMGGAPNFNAANDAAARGLSGWNPAMPYAAHAASGGLASNPWGQALGQYGSGENPHLRGLFDQGAAQVSDAVNANFMRGGRFGANAAHGGALTRELGSLWSNIAMPAYENERNRGLSAMQTAGSLFDSGQNRTMAGIGLYGDMNATANTDATRMMAMLPSLYQYGQAPGQSLLDLGGMYEGMAGEYLADDMARYQYPYQSAWNHLNNYAGLMAGLPDFSGSSTTSPAPRTNRVMSGLGGAAAGAGLASSLMSAGAINSWNPVGWAMMLGGGLLGAMG